MYIALQIIMPEIQVTFFDFIRYILISIGGDVRVAIKEKCLIKEFFPIIKFRLAQYIGTYKGNHSHVIVSKRRKENYYYPTSKIRD